MVGHSKAELLERLKQGNITLGWGAIVAFDRAHINQILQEQYLANFNDLSFLVPFSRSFFTDADRFEEIQLDRLILGEPRLSFESATLGDSQATLTMSIISGGYTSTSHVPARPPLVRESFNFREDMGYQVRMMVDLAVVQGMVDERGRVSLDLSRGFDVTCNLGSSDYSQRRIGDAVKAYLGEHPAYRKIFMLGMVDYNDYSPLAPRSFQLRTQAAPGGADTRSANYGEGALVVFIQLTSNPEEGTVPVNDRGLPYLIPNDLEENGQPSYSATVVVERRLIPFANEGELDVLKHLLFPGNYAFTDSENPHTPHDLVLFGNISLRSDARIVEPGRVAVKGGLPTRFNVFSGTGAAPTPTRWSVSNLDSPLSVGSMAANGTYTPLAPALMGRHQQVSVVTAHYADSQGERSYSGLVQESYESLVISPRVCTWDKGMKPVNLKVSSQGNNPLDWTLVGDPKGTLEVIDSHNAVFSPQYETGKPVWIQTIEVKDRVTGEFTRAAVIMIVAPQSLRILPYHVPTVTASSSIQFRVADLQDPARAKWEVYGEGSISPSGVFTPLSRSETPASVVLGEVSDDAWGYAIVQLVEHQQEAPRWAELTGFGIEALDTMQCYTNGMQQIPLRIKIETKSVVIDGHEVDVPLSDVELSTLKLVDRVSNAEIPFIEAHQEGIEGNELPWAVNVQRNRFRLNSSAAVKDYDPAPPIPQNSRTRYRELYVQSTFEGSREFYVQFQAADNTVWRSIAQEWPSNTIQLRGVAPPTPIPGVGTDKHYDFTRERAFNGVGEEMPDDPFSYLLDSIDYWKFGYRRQGIYPVGISTLKVLGNASTLQYESEQLDEVFGSYTGYGFYPQPFGRTDNPPAGLVFDAYFKALCHTESYKGPSSSFVEQHRPSPGQLIVSLHRVADMPYWHDSMTEDPLMHYRERLDGPVTFLLRDEEGNRHRFDVSFDTPTREDSRNRLVVNFQ